MKASELLVRCLENEEVEYVFGIPGEEILDIMDSLSRSRIKFVLTRHEQGAALMANVYGRLTGKAGVCLSTIGPGATNLITGVANAFLDYSPLVAISGQTALDRMYKETHQCVNVVEMFRPVTKWNTRVELPETLPELVRKAFKLAQMERQVPLISRFLWTYLPQRFMEHRWKSKPQNMQFPAPQASKGQLISLSKQAIPS